MASTAAGVVVVVVLGGVPSMNGFDSVFGSFGFAAPCDGALASAFACSAFAIQNMFAIE